MTSILSDDEGPAPAAAGTIRPEAADPLAPPPPSPRNRWQLAAWVLLALLFNLLGLAGLFVRSPDRVPPRPPEPPAISVELVKPQEKPKPQPQPKAPEEKKQDDKQFYSESGGDPKLKMGSVSQADKKTPEPKPEAREKKSKPAKAAIPDWAKLQPGGDVPAPSREKGASEADGAPVKLVSRIVMGEGGGDPYLNALRDMIHRNVIYPPPAGGRSGVAVWSIIVSHAGKIRELTLLRSSGSADLDYAAMLAIRRSEPFDPLPDNYANVVQIVAPIQVAPGR